jgi:hypothetical protein
MHVLESRQEDIRHIWESEMTQTPANNTCPYERLDIVGSERFMSESLGNYLKNDQKQFHRTIVMG